MAELMTERLKKAFDFAGETTKQLLTLSTGIIALTITFAKDILKSVPTQSKGLLFVSWCVYLISIFAGLFTLMALTSELEPVPSTEADADAPPSGVASPPSADASPPHYLTLPTLPPLTDESPPSIRSWSVRVASATQVITFFIATILIVVAGGLSTGFSVAGKGGADSTDAKKLQAEFFDALTRRDVPALERLYANDFFLTGGFGEPFNKAQLLTALQSGELVFDSFGVEGGRAAAYGEVVLHSGSVNVRGRYKNVDLGGRYQFSNVFSRKDDEWHAVASQWVRAPAPQPAQAENAAPPATPTRTPARPAPPRRKRGVVRRGT